MGSDSSNGMLDGQSGSGTAQRSICENDLTAAVLSQLRSGETVGHLNCISLGKSIGDIIQGTSQSLQNRVRESLTPSVGFLQCTSCNELVTNRQTSLNYHINTKYGYIHTGCI